MNAFQPGAAIRRMQKADAAFMSGRLPEAEPLYMQLSYQEVAPLHVQMQLGRIALLQDRAGRAGEYLTGAWRLEPGVPQLMALMADLYRRHGHYAEAAPLFEHLEDSASARLMRALAGAPAFVARLPDAGCRIGLERSEPVAVLDARINGRPARLLLDTAAEETVLDSELAAAAGVEPVASGNALFAGGRSGRLQMGILERLALGEADLARVAVQMQPLSEGFEEFLPGAGVNGILGTSALYRFNFELDLAAGALHLRPRRGRSPEPMGDGDVPLWLAGGFLPVASVRVGEVRTPALLDTGLAGIAFAAAASTARAAGKPREGPAQVARGGGGGVPLLPLELASLALDGHRVERPQAVWMPQFPLEHRFGFHLGGLIGFECLRGTRLAVDFDRMRLRID